MPNHIKNRLIITADNVHEILTFLRTNADDGERPVDFNKLVPMPEILRGNSPDSLVKDWAEIATGLRTVDSLNKRYENVGASFAAGDYKTAADAMHQSSLIKMLTEGPFPKDFEEDRFNSLLSCMRAIRETGFVSWYEWALKNWGTKWNAYDAAVKDGNVLWFDTAWSAVPNLIGKLSELFPSATFNYTWADEDIGSNTGRLVIAGGELVSECVPENSSIDAYDIAFELRPDCRENYELIAGKYTYKDEDE